jgi:hypothetical protein
MDHHTEALSTRGLATALLTVLLCTALPGIARALPHDDVLDDADDEEALFVGNINADAAADTIFGRLTTSAQYRPTRIAWGDPTKSSSTDRVSESRHGRSTRFLYPDWAASGASISISDMNADSLADMVLYLWGTDRDDRASTRSISVILFGSPGADTVGSIDLASPNTVRPGALVPVPLAARGFLVDPAVRDHTGIASFVRLPVAVPSNELPLPETPGTVSGAATVTLYPNPASGKVKIVAAGLRAGGCTITTMDLEGKTIRTIPGDISRDGRLALTLDLESLPSGYYIVRIDDSRQTIKSLPLLVVH